VLHVHIVEIILLLTLQEPSATLLAMKTRTTLHRLETLTYCATNDTKHIFADVNQKLENLYSEVYKQLPATDGLVLRPRDQKQVVNTRRRVWKAKVTLHCSALKPHKRKKKPCSYRNRFGIKADRLAKEAHDKERGIYNVHKINVAIQYGGI